MSLKNINKIISEVIDQVNEDYPSSFDMEYFKTLNSYQKRITYCTQHLQKIGAGTARIVYKIDDSKVLKLAKNEKGVQQNSVEIGFSNDYYVADVFAETYDSHPRDLWLEMEYCKKITPARFRELVGVSFKVYEEILAYQMWHNNYNSEYRRGVGRYKRQNIEKPEYNYEENDFIVKMVDVIINYDMPTGDFTKLSTYGENSKGNVVVVDYGLSYEIQKKYYKKSN